MVLLLCAQPDKMLNKTALTKDFRRVAKSIIKNTETNFYRPDLTKGTLLLRLLPANTAPALRLCRCASDLCVRARPQPCSPSGA